MLFLAQLGADRSSVRVALCIFNFLVMPSLMLFVLCRKLVFSPGGYFLGICLMKSHWSDCSLFSQKAHLSGCVIRVGCVFQPLERLLISYCSPPSAVIRRDPPSAWLSRLCGSSASSLWLLSGSSPVLCVPAFRQCVQRENSFHFPVLEFVSSPDSRSRIYFHLGILCNDYLLKSRCPRPALWLSRCSSRL